MVDEADNVWKKEGFTRERMDMKELFKLCHKDDGLYDEAFGEKECNLSDEELMRANYEASLSKLALNFFNNGATTNKYQKRPPTFYECSVLAEQVIGTYEDWKETKVNINRTFNDMLLKQFKEEDK